MTDCAMAETGAEQNRASHTKQQKATKSDEMQLLSTIAGGWALLLKPLPCSFFLPFLVF